MPAARHAGVPRLSATPRTCLLWNWFPLANTSVGAKSRVVSLCAALLRRDPRRTSRAALHHHGDGGHFADRRRSTAALENLAGEVGQARPLAAGERHVAGVRPALE